MEIKEGQRYLYKFGWFGTSFGGPTAWLFGKKYECVLTVEREITGTLWFKDNGIWFDFATQENVIKMNLQLL